jgi:hypothetical protein
MGTTDGNDNEQFQQREMTMNPDTREKLMGVSVATLCSALYKRGLKNQTIQDVRPVRAKGRNMVGPAFTLRYMPAREDRNPMSVFRDPKHPQRHASRPARKAQYWSWTAAKTHARLRLVIF